MYNTVYRLTDVVIAGLVLLVLALLLSLLLLIMDTGRRTLLKKLISITH